MENVYRPHLLHPPVQIVQVDQGCRPTRMVLEPDPHHVGERRNWSNYLEEFLMSEFVKGVKERDVMQVRSRKNSALAIEIGMRL